MRSYNKLNHEHNELRKSYNKLQNKLNSLKSSINKSNNNLISEDKHRNKSYDKNNYASNTFSKLLNLGTNSYL